MAIEMLVLRVVHILGGIFWVGSGLFTSLFLIPVLARGGPAAGQVMAGLQQRRLFTVLPTVAILTILSGIRLMGLTSGGYSAAYFASGPGQMYSMSGGIAIVAFIFSLLVARPAAVRSAALGSAIAGADESTRSRLSAELDRVRRRGAIASTITIILLVLAAVGMAVGRYVG